jgi:glycine cleavage system aminomethyltransferase T
MTESHAPTVAPIPAALAQIIISMTPRIRHSPFFNATVRDGVSHFSVYNKMLMPTSYGDLAAELHRLMHGVAMWDVGVERQVEVSGPDADRLVQYLSARDLSKMKAGQGKYVAMCDHQGRLLNDPILLKLSDRYWFSLADSDMLLWVRAIAAEGGYNVDVCEPDVSPLAIQGPKAEDVVAKMFGESIRSIRYFGCVETELSGIPIVLCRSGWSKQGGFELFLRDGSKADALWEMVKAAGQEYGIGPGAPNHTERVESALLSWGGDTTPDSNPFEANMAKFVDVDTSVNYIGKAALQKVVAQGPKRLFVGLVLDGSAPSDWPLGERVLVTAGGRDVGTMSAVVFSPRLGRTIGLAQVERQTVEANARLEVHTPKGVQGAVLAPIPFV